MLDISDAIFGLFSLGSALLEPLQTVKCPGEEVLGWFPADSQNHDQLVTEIYQMMGFYVTRCRDSNVKKASVYTRVHKPSLQCAIEAWKKVRFYLLLVPAYKTQVILFISLMKTNNFSSL